MTKNKAAVTFKEASYEQLERLDKLLDKLPFGTIMWLIRWTEGNQQEWLADYDMRQWEDQRA